MQIVPLSSSGIKTVSNSPKFSDLNKYFLVPSILICLLIICGREIENSLESKSLNSFERLVI